MKTIKLIAVIAILLGGFASCSKNYDDSYNNSGGVGTETTTSVITQGSWRISYISNEGLDITSDFSGYSFVFDSTGTVTATNAATSSIGSWAAVEDANKNTLMVDFRSAQAPLNALKDEWNLFGRMTTQVKMQLQRPTGRIDYFTIEKIER